MSDPSNPPGNQPISPGGNALFTWAGKKIHGLIILLGTAAIPGAYYLHELMKPHHEPPSIEFFSADTNLINPGQSVELDWAVRNSSPEHLNVQIYPKVGGELPQQGKQPVSPEHTTTYQLVVTQGEYVARSSPLTVIVNTQQTAPPERPQEDAKKTSPSFRSTSPQVAEARRPERPRYIIPAQTAPQPSASPSEPPTSVPSQPAISPTPTPSAHRFTRSTLTWSGDVNGATDVVLQQPSTANVGRVVNGKLPGENCRITVLDGSAELQQPAEGPCQQLHFRVNGQGLTKVTFEVHLTSYHP
jgi:hypothetical protein